MSPISYLTPTVHHWACDIEADNLLDRVTKVWCVTLLNVVTKVELAFTDRDQFLQWRKDTPTAVFVGHNFLAYDCVVLNRLWGAGIRWTSVVDTFVLSQLFNPSLPKPAGLKGKKGPHSLEAWGIRLHYPKGEFDDFSQYSDTMLRYCRRDTRLAALLFRRLTERMLSLGFTELGCEIEHSAWNIIQNKQKKNGFPFDYERAHKLYVHLREREEELKNAIYELWPPSFECVKSFAKAYRKDGTRTVDYERHLGQYPELRERDDGGYDAYDWVSFDLGSPAQRIEKLIELGWEPVNLTKAGNPKVDEDELLAYAESSGTEEVGKLAKWIVINSRANMIRTWMNAYNESTGAIHGGVFIASTLRYRHNNPNSANIPAVRLKKNAAGEDEIQFGGKGAYTYECRDLWNCGDFSEWSLMGIDGKGIQNRCLIHNLIKTVGEDRVSEFKELALAGDIHKRNIDVLGLANKAASKKFYFTLMMGGGGGRLAADQAQFGTKMTPKEGEAKKRKLIASMPGFGELIKSLEKELDRTGRIRLCDGTPIIVPSPHMVIPYLLQGDESRLMKLTLAYINDVISANRWTKDVLFVANIHDEIQIRVRNELVEALKEAALPCFLRAGEKFSYNIPIEGDCQVGKTWAEAH